jgi:phage/plasmid-like protein (TIGR03299 family)
MLLDNIISTGSAMSELLINNALNWEVIKSQLITKDGTETEFFATQRTDNKRILGVVKDTYEPFQNSELAELVLKLADTLDFTLKGGGTINGGRKVFLQLNTESIKGIGENNDTIKRYITALNSHDGSSSIAFGNTHETVSCENTFFKAYKELEHKIRHTESMHKKIEIALRSVERLVQDDKIVMQSYFDLASKPIDEKIINSLIRELTNVDMLLTPQELKENYSTQAVNKANRILQSIEYETSYKGATYWGLLSGITHYTTHIATAPERENGRIESKYFGANQNTDKFAYEFLTENL